MPVWRCPHCATPQAESSRCWVCHRSTTSCGTCFHFRRGVAGGLGLCGLDPRRLALTGAEIRPCWTAPDLVVEEEARERVPVAAGIAEAPGSRSGTGSRTFVPVDELDRVPDEPPAARPPRPAPEPAGWSLWGDPEP